MSTTTYQLVWIEVSSRSSLGTCTQCGKLLVDGHNELVAPPKHCEGGRYCGADCAIQHARSEPC